MLVGGVLLLIAALLCLLVLVLLNIMARKFLRDAVSGTDLHDIFTPFNIGILLLFIGSLVYLIISRRHLPPGPFSIPIIGNLHIVGNGNFLYRKLFLLRKQYGNVFRLTLGTSNAVVVLGHDLVREALVQKGDKFQYRPNWLLGIRRCSSHRVVKHFFNSKSLFDPRDLRTGLKKGK
ncbi:cytochrome P450 2C30-like [Ylistrum balloti]|uniref:cytochrome P450 2C30-like n=1 Tax=Ylistrum balloti TaxID=509963 RepID=UPI002905D633|nr:cytochrome P450 2C30-like [Ylistrum balloti]